MSSLQKFHRRTTSVVAAGYNFSTVGVGSTTVGYFLGYTGASKLIVAPKTTEMTTGVNFGSFGTSRNTTSTTDGLANTNTLHALGQAAHPAAYYCKTLSSGGYNTWYLPAIDEAITLYTNNAATPFATANGFTTGAYYITSTEVNANTSYAKSLVGGYQFANNKNNTFVSGSASTLLYHARAVRQV